MGIVVGICTSTPVIQVPRVNKKVSQIAEDVGRMITHVLEPRGAYKKFEIGNCNEGFLPGTKKQSKCEEQSRGIQSSTSPRKKYIGSLDTG